MKYVFPAVINYSSSDKDGSTHFYIGEGKDSVAAFNSSSDKVVATETITNVTADSSNVTVGTASGSVVLESVAGSKFGVDVEGSELVAYVAENINDFDGSATYYNATASKASLKTSADAESVSVWLNDEVGADYGNTTQILGNVKVIDGSSATGDAILVGRKDIANTIVGGKSYSTLWGGGISNDLLVGGDGVDTFYYMMGNGHDTISKASATDVVDLSGVTMDQITSATATSNSVALEFSDGGTLQLTTNNGTKFMVQGSAYTVDKSGNWTKN